MLVEISITIKILDQPILHDVIVDTPNKSHCVELNLIIHVCRTISSFGVILLQFNY